MNNRNTFFYSDPHFGHSNIIKYCNRPFNDVDHMNEELVKRYKETVNEGDLVIWLGDCWYRDGYKFIIDLPGDRILLPGNHDYSKDGKLNNKIFELGFTKILEKQSIMKIAGAICKLNHQPFKDGTSKYEDDNYVIDDSSFDFLIHGHTHKAEKVKNRAICVCVEAWDYYPINISDIEKLILGIDR